MLSFLSYSIEVIYPNPNPHALQDQRFSSLVQYAMNVEKAMFEMATGREKYYQLLAEKIYRIRKELEERRKMKLEMDKGRPMEEGGFVAKLGAAVILNHNYAGIEIIGSYTLK